LSRPRIVDPVSEEVFALAEKLARYVQKHAHDTSEKLAAERGKFPNWAGSIWDTKYYRPMRNAFALQSLQEEQYGPFAAGPRFTGAAGALTGIVPKQASSLGRARGEAAGFAGT